MRTQSDGDFCLCPSNTNLPNTSTWQFRPSSKDLVSGHTLVHSLAGIRIKLYVPNNCEAASPFRIVTSAIPLWANGGMQNTFGSPSNFKSKPLQLLYSPSSEMPTSQLSFIGKGVAHREPSFCLMRANVLRPGEMEGGAGLWPASTGSRYVSS